MLRSDLVLEHDVKEELACDAACKVAQLAVTVKNGIVRLSGLVPDPKLRSAAVLAVKRVFGVEGVDPHIEVAMPPTQSISATAVAAEAVL